MFNITCCKLNTLYAKRLGLTSYVEKSLALSPIFKFASFFCTCCAFSAMTPHHSNRGAEHVASLPRAWASRHIVESSPKTCL